MVLWNTADDRTLESTVVHADEVAIRSLESGRMRVLVGHIVDDYVVYTRSKAAGTTNDASIPCECLFYSLLVRNTNRFAH